MHRPFEVLARWIDEGRLHPRPKAEERCADDDDAIGAVSRTGPPTAPASDDALFAEAMDGVRSRSWNHVPLPPSRPLRVKSDPDSDVRRELEAVCASAVVGPVESREYVEGANDPIGRLYLPALGKGRFSVQGHLDLHGMTVTAAREEVERFLRDAFWSGHSCVRIVHGRGRHSDGREPRIKRNVERWLGQRRLARFVLAYATAHPNDGGGGAVYVLLKPGRGRRIIGAVGRNRDPRTGI